MAARSRVIAAVIAAFGPVGATSLETLDTVNVILAYGDCQW
jgi:hypothetical protein